MTHPDSELAVEESNVTERGEAQAARRLRERWQGAKTLFAELGSAKERRAARELYFGSVAPAFRAVRGGIDEVLAINQDA